VDESELRLALKRLRGTGLPLLAHAEAPGPVSAATARLNDGSRDWRSYATYLASRPDASELEAIALLIRLAEEFRAPVHIVHLATAEALPMLADARRRGVPVTVETCSHYLWFAAEEIADGATDCKCAPPIRRTENREKLWKALEDGSIDMVVTDHSPCPSEMKHRDSGRFDHAWGGLPASAWRCRRYGRECGSADWRWRESPRGWPRRRRGWRARGPQGGDCSRLRCGFRCVPIRTPNGPSPLTIFISGTSCRRISARACGDECRRRGCGANGFIARANSQQHRGGKSGRDHEGARGACHCGVPADCGHDGGAGADYAAVPHGAGARRARVASRPHGEAGHERARGCSGKPARHLDPGRRWRTAPE